MAQREAVRLGVLVSGGGTNLQAVLDACAEGRLRARVAAVISDRDGVFALERAAAAGVETDVIRLRDHADRDAFSAAVAARLAAAGVELVALAGWLKIFTAPMLEPYAGRILNTHPALLPSFGGPGMYGTRVHQAVLDAGCKLSCCTVHIVTEAVDGGPIVAQAAVPVAEDDTPESLQQRILPYEHRLLVEAIELMASGRVTIEAGRAVIAGREV